MKTDKCRRILLIDDRWKEENLPSLITIALEDGNYEWIVESIAQGEEALEELRNPKSGIYDVILLDLIMEGQALQGHELLPRIKKIDLSIPVVILSSKLDAIEVQRTLHHGALFYCEKRLLGIKRDKKKSGPQEVNPRVLLEVLEATQKYPEEREFEIRLKSLELGMDDATEELQATGRLLQRTLSAMSMHTVHEFESTSRGVGVSSFAPELDQLRAELLLGSAVLSACQAGDALIEELKRQAHKQPEYEKARKEAENDPEFLTRKKNVGARLANRTLTISVLEKLEKLSSWQTGALIMISWFRDLVANPFLDHGLDLRSDAAFTLDLMLAVLEDYMDSRANCEPYTMRSLLGALERLDADWKRFFRSNSSKSNAKELHLSYREWLGNMINSANIDPAKSCSLAVQAVRAVRAEVATQLQYLGARVPPTWDPMKDGSTTALEAFRSAAMSPIRNAFPAGAWGRSEKFFRCYGHTMEWLGGSEATRWTARLAARACLAVFDWWVHDYLPWCEQINWATKSQPRSLPVKKPKDVEGMSTANRDSNKN